MAKIVQILTRPSEEYSKQVADSQVRDLDAVSSSMRYKNDDILEIEKPQRKKLKWKA